MSLPNKNDDIASLRGPFRAIYFPIDIGSRDPAEIGRAMAAWDYHLVRHEIELLEHLARGLTNEQIAELVGAAEVNTIKKQLKSVFKKLHVRNRVQAAGIVAKYGFAGESDPRGGQLEVASDTHLGPCGVPSAHPSPPDTCLRFEEQNQDEQSRSERKTKKNFARWYRE